MSRSNIYELKRNISFFRLAKPETRYVFLVAQARRACQKCRSPPGGMELIEFQIERRINEWMRDVQKEEEIKITHIHRAVGTVDTT